MGSRITPDSDWYRFANGRQSDLGILYSPHLQSTREGWRPFNAAQLEQSGRVALQISPST